MSNDIRSSVDVAAGHAGPPDHRVVVEDSPKRVRAFFAGRAIADSRRVKLMHETGHLPVYYFPRADIDFECLVASQHTSHCPVKGEAHYWTLQQGQQTARDAVWNYPNPVAGCPDISGRMAFHWQAMDAWYEEEEQVFVHARDPYKRVEVLESARHIEVAVDGVTVADTHRPFMLLETGLPVRFYLPKLDVRMDLLAPSTTQSACPYKGTTSRYWSLTTARNHYPDLAWCYEHPTPGAGGIAGRVCFYNEKIDLYLDGEPQERPVTHWS